MRLNRYNSGVTLIGMPEAAKRINDRLGMRLNAKSVKRTLRSASLTLVPINKRALAIEDSDIEAFILSREKAEYSGRGRPRTRPPVEPEQGG